MYVFMFLFICYFVISSFILLSLLQTVQLFSYLNDKDMFAEIYRNQVRSLCESS